MSTCFTWIASFSLLFSLFFSVLRPDQLGEHPLFLIFVLLYFPVFIPTGLNNLKTRMKPVGMGFDGIKQGYKPVGT